MKTIRSVVLLVMCGLIVAGGAVAAGADKTPSAREIAAKPELIVVAILNQDAAASAAIVAGALEAIFSSNWSEAKKREQCIAVVTYAVAAKGKDAAAMMGIVAARVPAAWLPVIAATAVVAAGDSSSAVAQAMLDAVGGNAALAEACRAACAKPATVLTSSEIGSVRGILLSRVSPGVVKALPTIIKPANKYSGQDK